MGEGVSFPFIIIKPHPERSAPLFIFIALMVGPNFTGMVLSCLRIIRRGHADQATD